MREHTHTAVYARAENVRTRAMRKRIPNHSADYKRIDPEAIWPRSLGRCADSNMKPRSEMLLEVTVYCGKVRDQRGCQNMKYTTVEAS